AAVNPHATVIYLGDGEDPDAAVSYKPQVSDGWRKPAPADPLVPAWYDLTAFRRVVFAHIGNARNGGRDLPLGEFIRSFAGLSSTVKAKGVKAAVPGIETLAGFEADPAAVAALLSAM